MIDKHIFQDIVPAKKYLILMLLSNIIQVCLISAASYIIAYLADRLLFAELKSVAAAPLLALLLFFLCCRAYLHYRNNLTAEKISLQLQSKLRYRLLEVLAYSPSYKSKSEGDWLALVTKGVDKLDTYLTGFLPQLGILITFPLVLLCCAFFNDWISGFIFLGTAPLIPLFMILIGKIADKENKRQWALFQQLTNFLSDLLPGLLILKVYNQIDRQIQETDNNGKKFSEATLKVLRIAFLSAFMLEFIATLSIAVIAVNIGLRLLYGEATFLPVFFILLIAPQFYEPFRQFGSAFHNAMNGITASTEIYSLLHDFSPKTNSFIDTNNNKEHKISILQAPQIKFSQVSYTYNNDRKLLHELNFTIPANKQTALIGKNGAGKSTILKLLINLIQPQSGEIYINDKKLHDLPLNIWRNQIGCVLQEPYIFSTTIAENISLGRQCSMQDIINACKLANLDEFIRNLSNGYDTQLGSEQKLSFGQKRRLGIARAMLYQPKLLLLDEPMENLDSGNEQLIQALLNRLAKDTTILIIAHRQHTIAHAQHIILLENGQTFEFNNLAELNNAKTKINIAERNKNDEHDV